MRISRAEIADYERRIEYWDAATEVAMVCEPVSVYHEQPGQLLAGLLNTIAHLRGSPIATFGAADLLLRNADGTWRRILEADQTVYLHPRATRPEGARIEVGSDTLPDVVLEVDNTTDVRRAASWRCTSRGASRRCGSRCLTSPRRAARPACAPA